MGKENEVPRESYGKLPDIHTIERLNKIINEIKENTVALVEMGIAVNKLEKRFEQLLKKGGYLG